MKQMRLGTSELQVSRIALGCARLTQLDQMGASQLLHTALEEGINFFDHADIYDGGACETLFSKALELTPSLREKLVLQTKCGICPGYFDSSREHILESVDNSLRRLNTEYVDVLLLHRPDTLMEPEEVARAFESLRHSGKVRHFGVSNQAPGTMELLSQALDLPLVANQLQFSPTNTGMIDFALHANMQIDASVDRDGGVLEYCRRRNITIQAWSPFQYGTWDGVYLGNEVKWGELNEVLRELSREKGISPEAVVISWILRHPAGIQPVVGTTNARRLREICRADGDFISRPEWYRIYQAAGHKLP